MGGAAQASFRVEVVNLVAACCHLDAHCGQPQGLPADAEKVRIQKQLKGSQRNETGRISWCVKRGGAGRFPGWVVDSVAAC